MAKRRGDETLTNEEFKKLYDESNGFMSTINSNHPVYSGVSDIDFFQMLEEGCDLLIKNSPNLLNVPSEGNVNDID